MRRTVTHIGFLERKRHGVPLEEFTIHHCVNDHAGICYITQGKPRNLMRQYDLDLFLRVIGAMLRLDPEAAVNHLKHNMTMAGIITMPESTEDHCYTYYVGARLYARLLKSRSQRDGR